MSSPDEVTQSQEAGWFAPTLLEILNLHHHEICNWEMHYGLISGSSKTTLKPNAGLPPLVKAFTDQFALKPGLDPNEIFRKISICFRLGPLWANAKTCVCLKKQVKQRTRVIRRKTPNLMKIEFTYDVLKFKEIHQLNLPPNHIV
jgi:hypothetical protein